VAKFEISLASARINANLTQQEVADKMHISKQTLVNWEKYRTEPSVTQADELIKLYNLPRDCISFKSKNALKVGKLI